MPQIRSVFTRASGTTVHISDDRIVTVTYTSTVGHHQRITTLDDFIIEWRLFGREIAKWEERLGEKLRSFPLRARPIGLASPTPDDESEG